MSKSLTLGVVAVLGAVVACGNSTKPTPTPNFVYPIATSADAGLDSSVLSSLDGSQLGDGDFTSGDGAFPSGDGDSTLPGSDAGNRTDGSTTGDAGGGDAAAASDAGGVDAGHADSDAGHAGSDAGSKDAGGSEPDAAATDAGGGGNDHDAGSSCGVSGLVAGNSCIGVVTCQDNNGTGVQVDACDVGGGAQHCCIETNILVTPMNTCRATACGSGLKEASCDGPEDCGGGAGICCMNNGATSCQSTCSATNHLCHDDADCAGTGKKCVKGQNVLGVTGYKWWGFCRG